LGLNFFSKLATNTLKKNISKKICSSFLLLVKKIMTTPKKLLQKKKKKNYVFLHKWDDRER
jgi:hypothetical protein